MTMPIGKAKTTAQQASHSKTLVGPEPRNPASRFPMPAQFVDSVLPRFDPPKEVAGGRLREQTSMTLVIGELENRA